MLDPDPPFRPVRGREGYLPLEDLGLIGDGTTAALVGLDGSIPWMCLPRFDSDPLFCGLLDHTRGGHFTLAPQDLVEARQRYEPDTGVLTTEMRSTTGLVRVTDALTVRTGADLTDDVPAGRCELVRSAVVLSGDVRLRVDLEPRGGGTAQALFSGLELRPSRRPDLRLHLRSNRALPGLHSTHDLRQGEHLDLVLSWEGYQKPGYSTALGFCQKPWIRDVAVLELLESKGVPCPGIPKIRCPFAVSILVALSISIPEKNWLTTN